MRSSAFSAVCAVLVSIAHVAPAQSPNPALDRSLIDSLRTSWVNGFRAKDAVALARLVTDDIVLVRGLAGTNPVASGKSAFRDFYATMFSPMQGSNPFAMYPVDVLFSGRWAMETGQFGPIDGPKVGAYVLVYAFSDEGTWRVSVWKFFSARPATTPPPP